MSAFTENAIMGQVLCKCSYLYHVPLCAFTHEFSLRGKRPLVSTFPGPRMWPHPLMFLTMGIWRLQGSYPMQRLMGRKGSIDFPAAHKQVSVSTHFCSIDLSY